MRIHVSFIDRVGITQEVLALLGARHLNLDAVEMVPPNVYIDAPTLSPAVLEELHDALFDVAGVQAVEVVDILPGQRRLLQPDALPPAMSDPGLAVDRAGNVLLAHPALHAPRGPESPGRPVGQLPWPHNAPLRPSLQQPQAVRLQGPIGRCNFLLHL